MIHFVETIQTPIGPLTLVATKQGLRYIDFDQGEMQAARETASVCERGAGMPFGIKEQLTQYFAKERKVFTLPIDWSDMPAFHKTCRERLLEVTYGDTTTYAQLASRAGSPKAVRAAGQANARNPMPIVIPCHRVLRTGGALGGYAGGLWRKEWLLAHEKEQK